MYTSICMHSYIYTYIYVFIHEYLYVWQSYPPPNKDSTKVWLFFFTYVLLVVVYVSHVMRIDFLTPLVGNLSK
jgi:hypothetical protein